MCLKLHSINWPSFIAWLPLLFEILDNMCITNACQPGCDVIKFEIDLIFLIKTFCYMTKKSRQKLNILKTKRAFEVKKKAFFIIFKGLSVAKNCLRSESAPITLFRMGIFGAAHGWGGGQKGPPTLKSVTHILQWWDLAQLYLT